MGPAAGMIGAAGIGAAGSIIGGGKASKSAEKAQQQSMQQQLEMAKLQNQWGRENSQWSVDANRDLTWENQSRMDRQTMHNRPDQVSDFGSISWAQDPSNGEWTQTANLDPQTKAMLGDLRGKQGDMIGTMETGFGVDNSVMDAMRGLQAPQLQQQRDAENARLAAMGLSTGSGSAWGNAQQAINDSTNRADLQAILAGQNAWLQGQQNIRGNLGALSGTETGWNTNLNNRPSFASAQVAQQAQTSPSGTPALGNIATNASNIGNAAGQATGNAWEAASTGVGNLAGTAWNAYNAPSQEEYMQNFQVPQSWNPQPDPYTSGNAFNNPAMTPNWFGGGN